VLIFSFFLGRSPPFVLCTFLVDIQFNQGYNIQGRGHARVYNSVEALEYPTAALHAESHMTRICIVC
jgi:hypothetical protein